MDHLIFPHHRFQSFNLRALKCGIHANRLEHVQYFAQPSFKGDKLAENVHFTEIELAFIGRLLETLLRALETLLILLKTFDGTEALSRLCNTQLHQYHWGSALNLALGSVLHTSSDSFCMLSRNIP